MSLRNTPTRAVKRGQFVTQSSQSFDVIAHLLPGPFEDEDLEPLPAEKIPSIATAVGEEE